MRTRQTWVAIGLIGALLSASFVLHGGARGAQTAVHGLTLAAMVFLVASGLSLVYGLMNVLNLAHGAIFMVGAYCAAVIISQPAQLALITAFPLAVMAGVLGGAVLGEKMGGRSPTGAVSLAWIGVAITGYLAAALFALANVPTAVPLDIMPILALGPVASVSAVMATAFIGSLATSVRRTSGANNSRGIRWLYPLLSAAGALTLTAFAEHLGSWFVALPSNPRYVLAIIVSTILGASVGWAMEAGLLKHLYVRHLTQVIMTFFVLIFLVQAVQVIFGRNTLSMPRPQAFAETENSCVSANVVTALLNQCSTFTIFGAQTSTYRLLIIAGAVLSAAVVITLIRYTRTGMHIRAGVHNAEMVEALGVDVGRVFRRTFVLGSALAAFGGAIAAPFLGANPTMALVFLIDATVVLLIGGLGSLWGAAFGALVLGLWTALSDITVLDMGLDPVITRVSVLTLFVLVLMIRPQGVFGGGRQ